MRHSRKFAARSLLSSRSSLSIACLSLSLAWAAACGDGEGRECRVGADCASGVCDPAGRCVSSAAPESDAAGNEPGTDGGPEGDAAERPDAEGDAALPGCTANKDGIITREEVPIQAGLYAKYRIAQNVDVSTAGTPIAGGRRAWDFSGALPNDANVLVETQALTGKWYAAKFAGATYAAKLRESTTLVGVFETSPSALKLRGVVSPEDGFSRTELTNDPPVTTLAFPLQAGSKWTSDVTVSGLATGVFSTYFEKYTAEVDASGELTTPLGKFDVLRVRIDLKRTVGLLVTTSRTYAFITECYGNIATIASKDNESDVEFTRAAEIRRIAP